MWPVISPLYANNPVTMQLLFRNSKFFGYYLPLDFVEDFEKSKDWYSSRKFIQESEYIYIRINSNGVWAQEPITGDGYSEDVYDNRNGIENFLYEIIDSNEIVITNNNTGSKYRKISNNFEYDCPAIENYIGRTILKDFILSGEIILDNDIITIPALDYGKFRIETWGIFSDYNANMYVYGFNRGWWMDMVVQDSVITIYEFERWIWTTRSGRKVYWSNKPQ